MGVIFWPVFSAIVLGLLAHGIIAFVLKSMWVALVKTIADLQNKPKGTSVDISDILKNEE